ncbi:3-oxoacyl-[acyl-carrier-protein] synthase III C-terminal domain-containing protein [Carnobacterium gallinarum]|uniref:3-oxoacyl-[acyl-carrier-protein] synthase III C-terminal domain-containing protein n=1 Tax=Carnobacterium gallinarum TaxID=2749 RepID=UPI000554EDEC|nr:3-oxoacyl-[acyl-carrier-protein] synthase III C-terminal domain-containing protein [Carnobacterium gallinarum]
MNQIEIKGYGTALPAESITLNDQTRYRVSGEETQLTLAVEACIAALAKAQLSIEDIDCIVSASAVPVQPIPCTAALIHERIAMGSDIPAVDINTTCTSFVTALDTFSYLIDAGRYEKVLIVSSEVGSLGLNPKQKESYELFSDGAAAFVLSKSSNSKKGVIYGMQRTWSEGAHATEIRGGLTNLLPRFYTEETHDEYLFDMKGKQILSLVIKKLPKMMEDFYAESQLSIDEVDFVIPHQASRAMPLIMKKINIPEHKFSNLLVDYGNMVSASIPFSLCKALDSGQVKENDVVVLIGTAAGMTTNILAIRL